MSESGSGNGSGDGYSRLTEEQRAHARALVEKTVTAMPLVARLLIEHDLGIVGGLLVLSEVMGLWLSHETEDHARDLMDKAFKRAWKACEDARRENQREAAEKRAAEEGR